MKYILITLLLASCSDNKHSIMSSNGHEYNIICLDGVEYYSKHDQFAPRFNRWGKIMLCNSPDITDPEFQPSSSTNI